MLNQAQAVNGPHAFSDIEKQFRPRFEIAHPTPRPHQRNHSEALQREIDEAETQLEQEGQETSHIDESRSLSQRTRSGPETLIGPAGIEPTRTGDGVTAIHNVEAADRSDIGTYPSLRASPIPTRPVQPSSDWGASSDIRGQSPANISMAHKVKPSRSKLNVEAQEFKFDPNTAFLDSNFQIDSKAFQPNATVAQLNATAPEFQPSKAMDAQSVPTRFTFSSSTFNVDAPEFNPSGSADSHLGSSIASGSDDPSSATSKIFGTFNIDLSSKATRRFSKHLPMTKPATDAGDV